MVSRKDVLYHNLSHAEGCAYFKGMKCDCGSVDAELARRRKAGKKG